MSDNAAANGAVVAGGDGVPAQEGEAAPAQQTGWTMVKTLLFRMVVIYMISSFIQSFRKPIPDASQPAGSGSGPPGAKSGFTPSSNMFEKRQPFDMYLYISPDEQRPREFHNNSDLNLFWKATEMIYGDWSAGPNGDGSFEHSAQIECPEYLQNNGSIYLHAFIVKSGGSPDPSSRYSLVCLGYFKWQYGFSRGGNRFTKDG